MAVGQASGCTTAGRPPPPIYIRQRCVTLTINECRAFQRETRQKTAFILYDGSSSHVQRSDGAAAEATPSKNSRVHRQKWLPPPPSRSTLDTDRPAGQPESIRRPVRIIHNAHTHTHTPVRTIYIYSQHASGGRDRRPRASPPPFVRHNTRHVITSPPGYPCTWCGTTTNRYLSHGGVTINLGPPAKTWSSGPTPSNQTSWKFYVQSNQMLTGSHVMLTTNQPTRCEKKFWGGMD